MPLLHPLGLSSQPHLFPVAVIPPFNSRLSALSTAANHPKLLHHERNNLQHIILTTENMSVRSTFGHQFQITVAS